MLWRTLVPGRYPQDGLASCTLAFRLHVERMGMTYLFRLSDAAGSEQRLTQEQSVRSGGNLTDSGWVRTALVKDSLKVPLTKQVISSRQGQAHLGILPFLASLEPHVQPVRCKNMRSSPTFAVRR